AVLDVEGDIVRQLCVRTCLGRGVSLAQHTELSVRALAARARSADPAAQRDLLEVFGLVASESDYRPVDVAALPCGAFAAGFARAHARRLLHNHGAIQSLERLLPLMHPQGFLLVNDYGQTQVASYDEFEHQRFAQATAVGLNFPLLKAYFGD